MRADRKRARAGWRFADEEAGCVSGRAHSRHHVAAQVAIGRGLGGSSVTASERASAASAGLLSCRPSRSLWQESLALAALVDRDCSAVQLGMAGPMIAAREKTGLALQSARRA